MYSQSLIPLLEPSKAYGFAGWQIINEIPTDSLYYQIDLIDSDFDTIGNPLFENSNLISSFLSSKNYVRLSNQLTNNPRVFIRITAYSATNRFLDEIIIPACGGCQYDIEAEWVCNGTTYAYEIKKVVHKSNNKTYLSIESAGEWDPINNVEIPYFLFMLQTTFSNNNYYGKAVGRDLIFFNVTHTNSVRNASGTHLNGLVVGIEKNKTKWEGPNWNYNYDFSCFPITVNTIHSSIYNTDPLSKAISISNINAANLPINCNNLECIPYPGKSIGNGSIPNGKPFNYDDSLRVTWYDYLLLDTIPIEITPVGASNPPWSNNKAHNITNFNQLIDLLASNDSNYNENPLNNYSISNFIRLNLKKIGDTSLANIQEFDISELFESGIISYPDLNLSDGLYRVALTFADTTMTFIYFEQKNDVYNNNLLISDLITTTIVPNPTNLTSVNVNFYLHEVSEEINLQVSVFDLNNNYYYNEQVFNVQNETIPFFYNTPPESGQLLFLKIVFDDMSFVVHSIIAQ